MYQIREREYYSSFLKKGFPHDGSENGKRRAKDAMDREHKQFVDAQNARSQRERGRNVTTHELLHGWSPPDTRTGREKIAEDAIVMGSSSPTPDPVNPYLRRAAEIKAQMQ